MKAGLFAASAVALLQLAAAQPHGHRHEQAHEKRQDVQVTTTVYAPEVVVYVDDDGNTVGATTVTGGSTVSSTSSSSSVSTTSSSSTTEITSSSTSSTPTPSSTSTSTTPTSSSTTPTPTTTSTSTEAPSTTAAPTTTKEATSSAAPASTSAASSSSSSSSGGNILTSGSIKGVSFSPYESDGSCYTQSKVESAISSLASDGFNAIRLYGVDCSQIEYAVPAAKSAGVAVIAGIFDIGSVESSLDSMKTQLNGDFSYLSGVSVYNEAINSGEASPSDVASAVTSAKSYLSSTNFDGLVFAVDTFNQLLKSANSAVIDASDIVAANCHAYFDTDVSPSGAADYVQTQISALEEVAGGKSVLITESGWPCYSPDGTLGSNTASNSDQDTAMSGLKAMNLFAFNPYSTAWHNTPDSVENYWGWGTC